MEIAARYVGAPNSFDYRVFFENNGVPISPFHDIPLHPCEDETVFNMVVEIPRWTNAKMEISKGDMMNPIKQDTKDGNLRYVHNLFPYHGYVWNYGAFPQTWEDPTVENPETKAVGDNDPVDVIEIGEQVAPTGAIKQVKVLGAIALLDEGQTDWKVIAIDIKDPLARKLNDIDDVKLHIPGFIRATKKWFRIYKMPDTVNKFAFNGAVKDKAYATKVIKDTHESWKRLITKADSKSKHKDMSLINLSVKDSPYIVPSYRAIKSVPAEDPKPAKPIPSFVDKWYYILRRSLQ